MPTLIVPTILGSSTHVTVYYVERGLAVQRFPETEQLGLPRWGIVHVPSGTLLVGPPGLASRAQARRCQLALLALTIDWEQLSYRIVEATRHKPRHVVTDLSDEQKAQIEVVLADYEVSP